MRFKIWLESEIIGYRNSNSAGTIGAGTFYSGQRSSARHFPTTLKFNNLLVLSDKEVGPFLGSLPSEALARKWLRHVDWREVADRMGVDEGAAMDYMVAQEAVRRGYDGIQYGNLDNPDSEIQDLRNVRLSV